LRLDIRDGVPGEVVGIAKRPLDPLRSKDVVAANITGWVFGVIYGDTPCGAMRGGEAAEEAGG